MPIKELYLAGCSKITGTSVGAVGLELRCCLKATPNTSESHTPKNDRDRTDN